MKRTNFKQFLSLFILFAAMFMAGCAGTTYQPPAECTVGPDGKYDSVILEKIDDPKLVSLIFTGINVEAVKMIDGYSVEDAYAFLDRVEQLAGMKDATYADLVLYVTGKVKFINEHFGIEIYLIADYLGTLDVPLPISECDQALIRRHLAKQRTMLDFYRASL